MSYLREWSGGNENTLIFVGYQAEGTIGKKIQRGAEKLNIVEKGRTVEIDINISIETCEGFSGHSDRKQLMSYVGSMDPRPDRILVGHGEEGKCVELASHYYRRYGMETRAPHNLETIRLR